MHMKSVTDIFACVFSSVLLFHDKIKHFFLNRPFNLTHFLKYKGSQSIWGLLWPYTHAQTNLKAVLLLTNVTSA